MPLFQLFAVEMLGGIDFGAVIGFLGYFLLSRIDNYQVEVQITLALVTGGYTLASRFHLSGPLAIVIAGLMIGNHGRLLAMSVEFHQDEITVILCPWSSVFCMA